MNNPFDYVSQTDRDKPTILSEFKGVKKGIQVALQHLIDAGCSTAGAVSLFVTAMFESFGSTEPAPSSTTIDTMMESLGFNLLRLDDEFLTKHGFTIDKKVYGRARVSSHKGTRCQICRECKPVKPYTPHWSNGAVAKCFILMCDTCLPIVKARHPDIEYKQKL